MTEKTAVTRTLYWKNGVCARPISDIALKLTQSLFVEIVPLYWWEPTPESLALEPGSLKPRYLMGEGMPVFTEGLLVDECRLFFPEGGLHFIRSRDHTRWFAFTVDCNEMEGGWKELHQVVETRTSVLLKDQDMLKNYGLSGDIFGGLGDLEMTSYSSAGKSIAWTLARRGKGHA